MHQFRKLIYNLFLYLFCSFEHGTEASGSTKCGEFHNTEATWRISIHWASTHLHEAVMPLPPAYFLTFFYTYPNILLIWMLVTITKSQPSLLTSSSLCVTWLPVFSHWKSSFFSSPTSHSSNHHDNDQI